MLSTDSEPQHTGDGEIIHVKMNKGVTGVGFVIQGGKGSPRGDQPITIKRIFKGKVKYYKENEGFKRTSLN